MWVNVIILLLVSFRLFHVYVGWYISRLLFGWFVSPLWQRKILRCWTHDLSKFKHWGNAFVRRLLSDFPIFKLRKIPWWMLISIWYFINKSIACDLYEWFGMNKIIFSYSCKFIYTHCSYASMYSVWPRNNGVHPRMGLVCQLSSSWGVVGREVTWCISFYR